MAGTVGSTEVVDVWGDESCGSNAVTYGCIAMPQSWRARVECALDEFKIAHHGNPWDEIHCSVMLNEATLAASPWSHLGYEGVMALFADLTELIVTLGIRQTVGIARKPIAGGSVDGERFWTEGGTGGNIPLSEEEIVRFDDKQLVLFCAWAAVLPLVEAFGAQGILMHLDPDEDTTLKAFGRRAKLMNKIRDGWVDRGASITRLAFAEVSRPKPPLLQIADFIACTSRRSELPASKTSNRFRSFMQRLNPVIFEFRPV